MRRRDFVSAAATLAAVKVLSPIEVLAQPAPAPQLNRFIDAHCHVFNAADLPVESFIEKIVLPNYSQSEKLVAQALHYPGAVAALVHALAVQVKAFAPNYAAEIELIDEFESDPTKKPTPAWRQRKDLETLQAVLHMIWFDRNLFRGIPAIQGQIGLDAVDYLQLLLYRELYPDFGMPFPTGGELQELQNAPLDQLATRIYSSPDSIGHYIRWALLFTRYRYELTENLSQLHAQSAKKSRLVLQTPALVDFSKWLEDDNLTSMTDQVAVMKRIARRNIDAGSRVHGFVAFDPLRKALYDRGIHKPSEVDPLAIVRAAIEVNQSETGIASMVTGGSIGVKLYPPMGFQASANATIGDAGFTVPTFIHSNTSGLGSQIGVKLDAALTQLYVWCSANNVPIMAHANNTYGPNLDYRNRANPKFWRGVLSAYPTIRINMAHFGHFNNARLTNQGIQGVEDCWEWITGDIINSSSNSYAYADISSLSEILKTDSSQKLLACMKAFNRKYPNSDQHLIYGTDWSFIAQAEDFPSLTASKPYPDIMIAFLKAASYSDGQIENIMINNAARFLGLSRSERDKFGDNSTRARLERFYAAYNLCTDWMTVFD